MDRIIYTSMTGANAAPPAGGAVQQPGQCVHPRFRAEMSTFRSVPMRGDGSTTRCLRWKPLPVTCKPRLALPRPPGATSTPWLSATPGLPCRHSTALEAYTRAGSFQVTEGPAGHRHRPACAVRWRRPIDVPPGAEVSLARTAPSRPNRGPTRPGGLHGWPPRRRKTRSARRRWPVCAPPGEPWRTTRPAHGVSGALEGST